MRSADGTEATPPTLIGTHASRTRGIGALALAAATTNSFVMRFGLFTALLIALALIGGVAFGFLAEQATQLSPSTQSSDATLSFPEPDEVFTKSE